MSNELKVTGGEWFIRDESDEPLEITSLSRKGRISICEVAVGYEGPVEVEQQANAHLLAASKKLYEALIQARESLADSLATPGGWYAIGSNHARDVIAEIDEALAAARGV